MEQILFSESDIRSRVPKFSAFAGIYRPSLRSQDSTKLSKLNSAYTLPKVHFNIIPCVPLDLTSRISISLRDQYLTFMSLRTHAFYVQPIFCSSVLALLC